MKYTLWINYASDPLLGLRRPRTKQKHTILFPEWPLELIGKDTRGVWIKHGGSQPSPDIKWFQRANLRQKYTQRRLFIVPYSVISLLFTSVLLCSSNLIPPHPNFLNIPSFFLTLGLFLCSSL